MNRLLLGTSVLALAGMATPAAASEWEIAVGGFSTQMVGYANTDVEELEGEDFDGVDVLSNTEVIFRPAITLDNGIRFGAQVQLEGNTSGDQIDESFAFVEGSFGRVLIGSENSAGYTMTFAAPCVALTCHNSGTLTAYIPYSGTIGTGAAGQDVVAGADVFRGTLGSTFIENLRNNDSQRVTYFTPRLFGVQLGFSYARDVQQDSSSAVDLDAPDTFGDFIDVGANYVNSFGGVDVAVSGRWGIALTTPDEFEFSIPNVDTPTVYDGRPTVYAFGANLGYAGVTLGGSFAEQNNSRRFTDVSPASPQGFADSDGTSYDVGLAYETGPWGISFSYLHGRNVDDETVVITGGSEDETVDKFVLGVNYQLAEGVDLGVTGAYVRLDEEGLASNEAAPSPDRETDVEGFIIGTGMALSF